MRRTQGGPTPRARSSGGGSRATSPFPALVTAIREPEKRELRGHGERGGRQPHTPTQVNPFGTFSVEGWDRYCPICCAVWHQRFQVHKSGVVEGRLVGADDGGSDPAAEGAKYRYSLFEAGAVHMPSSAARVYL